MKPTITVTVQEVKLEHIFHGLAFVGLWRVSDIRDPHQFQRWMSGRRV